MKASETQGRVDVFVQGAFDILLARHGNPGLQIARRVLAKPITECFRENLGPGTPAHRIAEKLIQGTRGSK